MNMRKTSNLKNENINNENIVLYNLFKIIEIIINNH